MQIVIDLPDNKYQWIKDNPLTYDNEYCEAIRKGIPLPKGHGRLIDADALLKEHKFFDAYPFPSTAIDNAPTIIEADVSDTNVGKTAESKVLDKIRSEIDRQEKWLLQVGCTAYNVDIAFDAIKSAVGRGDAE